MLSRRPNADNGEEDNQNLTLLPPELFICSIADPLKDWAELTEQINQAQWCYHHLLRDWKRLHPIKRQTTIVNPKIELWHYQGCIVIPPDEPLRRNILYHHHGHPTMGHSG